jgi:hypothetical protein
LDQLATTHCNATFELKVQTAAGRMLVREHSKHRDSLAVYKEFAEKYQDGTAALITITAIRKYLTNLVLQDWKQPIVSFLLKFKNLVLDFDN